VFFSSRRRHTSSDRDWSSDVCSSDLCFNQKAALDQREARLDELEAARERLSKGLTIKPELREFFGQDRQLLPKHLAKESRWDGLSFIFTTSTLTPTQVIQAYFDKDVVEKSFQALKGVVRLRPVRHWLSTHVEA